MTAEEILAVGVSVLGVWLTTQRSLWNFPFSLASVALYGHIFFTVKLYADMALQGVFALTLLYGLKDWRDARGQANEVPVTRLKSGEGYRGMGLGVCLAALIGGLLSSQTDAAVPWLDASLTAASLIATWWVARRRLESWWLWILADVFYVGVYIYKDLWLTAALYAVFVLLAVRGLRQWTDAYTAHQAASGLV